MKRKQKILASVIGIICCCFLYTFVCKAEETENPPQTIVIEGVQYSSNEWIEENGTYMAPTEYFVSGFEQAYDGDRNPIYTDVVIKNEVYGLPVTHANGWGFKKNCKVERIVFPHNCKSIVNFEKCIDLKEIVFGDATKTISDFEQCIKLERIIIPKSVKYIAGSSFNGCTALKEIVFEHQKPEKIRFTGKCFQNTAISNQAKEKGEAVILDGFLLDSGGLRGNVKLSEQKVRAIASYAFTENDFEIKELRIEGVFHIADRAFSKSNVKKLYLSNVDTIEKWAFNGSSIRWIKVNGIRKMSDGVFSHCKELKKCTMNNVSIIPQRTFAGCSTLRRVLLKTKKRVVWEDKWIFRNCKKLKTIMIDSNKVSTSIKNVELPKGVKLDVPNGKKKKYRKYVACKVI